MAFSPAEHIRQKREEARSRGLCITCRKDVPPESRSVCNSCNISAKVRVARMRERRRGQRQVDATAHSYEAVGDTAMERFAYIEATAQFERALAESSNPKDEARLYEKIGSSLFYGTRPDMATPWIERALECYSATDSLQNKMPGALQLLARQRWLEARTLDALDCSLQARAYADSVGNSVEVQSINASVAGWLILLGRYSDAKNYIKSNTQGSGAEEPTWARTHKLAQQAVIKATEGRAPKAFAEFDHSIAVAKELPSGYYTTINWDDYANWATALGRLDIARACRERALLVARERRIAWRIPYLSLRFAGMLIIAGDYEHARDLVHDALTYDINTPVIRVLLSTVGVELANTRRDERLLRKTMDAGVLDLAFRSGEPGRIAPIVAAYAKVQISRGQLHSAKTLIARGMDTINEADCTGELLTLATRYGLRTHRERARGLLLKRIGLPHHQVAKAYLALGEAYDANRRGAAIETIERARAAAQIFGGLGWKQQQAEALVLAGGPQFASEQGNRATRAPVLSDLNPVLTVREQQVAELALRGLTNRAIAQMLSISEHTVETHMTSILNRLGLRSRWQLIGHSY